MRKILLIITFVEFSLFYGFAQSRFSLTEESALKLSRLPLHCICQEFPNRPAHTITSENEVELSPKDLHPAFFGCLDWHSSVHGHWMLVRLLKTMPNLSNRDSIINVLDNSFDKQKIIDEANYFVKYQDAKTFERTYGWAWLLKLDEELMTWNNPLSKKWHENLQPLTSRIVELWKEYLPKQTYPNRTGVHPNSAFAMGFAIDWARSANDKTFENELIKKAKIFYLNDKNIPAYLEPDGTDFFSPSLETADLIRRILNKNEFEQWLDNYYSKQSLDNICLIPEVSDLTDFQIVHLVGLSFSRAWCMKNIINSLPQNNKIRKYFIVSYPKLLDNGLDFIYKGNYGGDHWLASFALLALE